MVVYFRAVNALHTAIEDTLYVCLCSALSSKSCLKSFYIKLSILTGFISFSLTASSKKVSCKSYTIFQ